jgi:GNAT superfamily N-acetyltransferase
MRRAHAWNLANGFNFTAATITAEDVAPRIAGGHLFITLLDGRVVGTVEVRPEKQPGLWSLHLLAVAPELAGTGLGKQLIAFAESQAQIEGAERLRLDTPENHPWLPAFYEKLGYRTTGTAQWEGKQYRSVLMEKTL